MSHPPYKTWMPLVLPESNLVTSLKKPSSVLRKNFKVMQLQLGTVFAWCSCLSFPSTSPRLHSVTINGLGFSLLDIVDLSYFFGFYSSSSCPCSREHLSAIWPKSWAPGYSQAGPSTHIPQATLTGASPGGSKALFPCIPPGPELTRTICQDWTWDVSVPQGQ